MKKLLLLTACMCLTVLQSQAQSRECATMEVLQHRMDQDPTLRARRDSIDQATAAQIRANGKTEDYSQLNLPEIPGFVPTGDPATDVRNFSAAKQELLATDPALYRKLSRNPSATNQTKSKR